MGKKSVAIGLTNLVYALVIDDIPPTKPGAGDGKTTYGPATRILGAITANFSPNASNDTLFADDGPYDTASTLGAMSLELNVADIPSEQRAELLGAQYVNGVLVHTSEDIPPYVAVGMSVKKSNGADRYIWYLKGKFSPPDDNNQTKSDSINWNTPTITGNFLKRDSDNQWRVSCDTDDENVSDAIKDGWFENPNVMSGEGGGGDGGAVAKPVLTPASGSTINVGDKITVTCATEGATLSWKKSSESTWLTVPAGGIEADDWVAGSTVIINLKASKTGMTDATANATYTVAAA